MYPSIKYNIFPSFIIDQSWNTLQLKNIVLSFHPPFEPITALFEITGLWPKLMSTQGVSAVVVGPDRQTIIMLDLDLYNCALQIQQTVGNTNWILWAGALHIVFAALQILGKQLMVVDLIHLQLKKAYKHLGIQARNRKPHHNQPSNHDGAIRFKCKRLNLYGYDVNLLERLSMSVVQIQMSSLKTSSLGVRGLVKNNWALPHNIWIK